MIKTYSIFIYKNMKNYQCRLFDFDILNIENETEQTDSDEDNEKKI